MSAFLTALIPAILPSAIGGLVSLFSRKKEEPVQEQAAPPQQQVALPNMPQNPYGQMPPSPYGQMRPMYY